MYSEDPFNFPLQMNLELASFSVFKSKNVFYIHILRTLLNFAIFFSFLTTFCSQFLFSVTPVITSFNVPTFARFGGNTSMTCQSNGIPSPQVTWYRDGSAVFVGSRVFLSRDGSLSIIGVLAAEGGVYSCVASNPAGRTSKKGNLTIQGNSISWR
jgi:hypothetical protein